MKHYSILALLLATFTIGGLQAQEKDSIGTQTVTVVKAYTPTVSDAFKIRSSPQLNDSIVLNKKNIEYGIHSVPVASTFTPAKGKAAGLEKTPPPALFNSYLSAGLGNYNNAMLDFYTSKSFNRGQDLLDVGLNHISSRGDIDGTIPDNDFYNTQLTAAYAKKQRDYDWGVDIGLQHQIYNWYGILEDNDFSASDLEDLDTQQTYYTAEAGAQVNMEDYLFKKGEVRYQRFWDAVDSGENRAYLKALFELPVTEESLTIGAKVDYVGGSFKNASLDEFDNSLGIDYSHVQFGVTPSLQILRDDLTLNLGANLVYGMDVENSEGNFYIYPEVNASYRLVEDKVIAYGGLEGELEQNTYRDFVDRNPFVSPTLAIRPTDRQYNGYVGLKGRLLPNLGYNVRGSYTAENYKPLFKLNPENLFRDDEKSYMYGNSFQLFYDDVKTMAFFGQLSLDVSHDFTMTLSAEVFDYETETNNPAWNLPTLKGSLFLDYQIDEHWYMGANLFYTDTREDHHSQAVQNVQPFDFPFEIVELDSYFDANVHGGYRFNNQLSIFVKAANLANTNYQKWYNYPVQGFQIMAGVTYKFDL